MPRARTVSIDEIRERLPNARGRYFTNKRGQKFIVFERKHKFPRGNGIRLQFKLRKTSGGGSLTDELKSIKVHQERAEKLANVKRGNGLFDNPLQSQPTVIGVVRIIRKKQVGRLLKLQQQGKKLTRTQQRRLFNIAKKKGAKVPRGTDPDTVVLLSQL